VRGLLGTIDPATKDTIVGLVAAVLIGLAVIAAVQVFNLGQVSTLLLNSGLHAFLEPLLTSHLASLI